MNYSAISYADVQSSVINEKNKTQIIITSISHNFFEVFNKEKNGTFLPASALEREVRKKNIVLF